MLPSFQLFGITLRPYSLLMIVGVCAMFAVFTALSFRRRKGTDENLFAIEMLLIATAAALPAAMVFDSLFHWMERGEFRFAGATFYGGLIVALPLFALLLSFKKRRAVPIYTRLCDLAPGIAAGHCLGRIGCFFGGCCFGAPTQGPFGVIFPEGSLPYEFYGGEIAIHPTQLYEAAFLFVLFLVLIKPKHAFPLYLILYGAGRFLLEFLRNDDRGDMGIFSPAQYISLVLILCGIVLLWAGKRRTKKAGR